MSRSSPVLRTSTGPQNPCPAAGKVTYSKTYDAQIKEIMDLALERHWEEAEMKADALYLEAPENPFVSRVHNWVKQKGEKVREQALEDRIRPIDAKNSVFNPTISKLGDGEQKDRGLPARKDVRDTVQTIENSRYIPPTYGKTKHEQGPLFDLESAKGRMSKVLEKKVSVHLDNIPLETILLNLSQTSGVNIVADKSLAPLKQILSVNLEKVKLE